MKSLLGIIFLGFTATYAQWTQTGAPISPLIDCITGDGQTIFAGTSDKGVVLSTDNGVTWTSVGLSDRGIFSLALGGGAVFAGTDSGLYRSTDYGSSWQSIAALAGKGIVSLSFDGNFWYVGTGGDGIFRSTDNGFSWPPSSRGLTADFIHTIVSNGPIVYAGTWKGVFSSTDYGTNWSFLAGGAEGVYENVRAFASANGSLFAGGAGGIQRSTDGGTTWASVGSFDGPRNFFLGFVVFHTAVFAYGWGGIFVSTDTGSTWTEVNTGLPTLTIESISSGDTTYIPSPMTHSLAIVGPDMFTGLDSNGIWRRPLGEIVTSAEQQTQSTAPQEFRLDQNFPNPFNPTTKIVFTIPHVSNVTITVFDVLGRKVQTIVSEELGAGTFSVTWDAVSLPSGVYLCRMQAGSFKALRKMILKK